MASKTSKLSPLDSLDPSKVQVGRPLLEDLTLWLPSEEVQGATLALVGSCVRNQMHGRQATEITIAVVVSDIEMAERVARAVDLFFAHARGGSHELAHRFHCHNLPDLPFYEILQYRTTNYCGLPIQITIYDDRVKNLADVADAFDYSIDQFVAWLEEGALKAEYFGSIKSWGTCVQLQPCVTAERAKRVKLFCAELGWTYEEDF